MINLRPIILCGGAGTRLWPLSRSGFPKQFLCLRGKFSLFQETATRVTNLGDVDIAVAPIFVVSNEEHRFLVSEQLREINVDIGVALLEPVGRNTAPALTLSALAATQDGDDPVLVVTPADQIISNQDAFTQAIRSAVREAVKGTIVILGVLPDRPETGYGYVKVSNQKISSSGAVIVERFVEKPNASNAAAYLEEGGYYWNSGIFVLKASVWLKAIEHFRPDIFLASKKSWSKGSIDRNFIRPEREEFFAIPNDSIDYAVMEQCPGSVFPIKMLPLQAGWSDLGSWDSVWSTLKKDEFGNAHQGDVLSVDCQDTLVHASSRLVGLVGVQDLVIIETADAVLVANKIRSQEVKNIVNILGKQGREESLLHRKVHRPWGWYDSIDEGHGFKVKRILVNPQASLSLQKHQYRAEHWIVVKGTAQIVCGDKTIILSENQSTYIPIGEMHRLTNLGTTPLEIIEVQSGSYLGEDDIVRTEDNYGRS